MRVIERVSEIKRVCEGQRKCKRVIVSEREKVSVGK